MNNIDVQEYICVVEDYIWEKKQRKVKIVFDNPMMMHRHFQMLCAAYDYIQQNKHK